MSDELAKEIAKGALRIEWANTESAARRVAEYAATSIAELEAKLAKAVGALEKLARLGNGDRYGNSDGNMIARTTLAELKGETDE